MPYIEFINSYHAELYYHVLSHLHLGSDAANLYDPRKPERKWSNELKKAYIKARGRIHIQVLPLYVDNLDDLYAVLTWHPQKVLGDEAGKYLRYILTDILKSESERFAPLWKENEEKLEGMRKRASEKITSPLLMLRNALYEASGMKAPHLRVFNCPSLGKSHHTRGRAVRKGNMRSVGVSLGADAEEILIQILHEEIHPVTDPRIRANFGNIRQDTRRGKPGNRLHRALEIEAVEHGETLLRQYGKKYLETYRKWRKRYGI